VAVKEFKKFCMSDEMDGKEDENATWNVGSKYESVRNECEIEDGNCEEIEFLLKFVI
jgi:hypothetical protein